MKSKSNVNFVLNTRQVVINVQIALNVMFVILSNIVNHHQQQKENVYANLNIHKIQRNNVLYVPLQVV